MLKLACGALEATLAPETGGSIARFTVRHEDGVQELLRPLPAGVEAPGPLDMACYPLVPFSGRITNGRFSFGGREVRLPPDEICVPHAIHGRGWRTSWEVMETDAAHARLCFVHEGGDAAWPWPWSFTGEQDFRLTVGALTVAMTLTNRADEPMPGGLGLHPFFEARSRARLATALPFVWESGAGGVPVGLASTPEKWRFDAGRPMKNVEVDHCFSGSGGRFAIAWEDRPFTLRIEAEGAPHAIVYAPPGEDFFCAEPVSHAPDAVNRAEPPEVTGLVSLAPGETMTLRCRFLVERR